jgi:hypothetical protein
MKISEVIHFSNNQVMVFDQEGNQMPELQGDYWKVRDKILKNANKDTIFKIGIWEQEMFIVDRKFF